MENNEETSNSPRVLEIIPASELTDGAKEAFLAAVCAETPEQKTQLIAAAIKTVKADYPSLLPS